MHDNEVYTVTEIFAYDSLLDQALTTMCTKRKSNQKLVIKKLTSTVGRFDLNFENCLIPFEIIFLPG